MFAQPARLAFPPAPRGDPPPHLLARRPPTRAETRARPRWHRRAEPRGPAAATVRRRGFVPFGNASRDRKVFFFGRKRKARAPRRKGSRVARARRDGLGGVRAFVVRLRVTGVTSHERGFVLVPLVVVVEAGGHARDPVLAIARRPRRAHHDALQVAERPAPPARASPPRPCPPCPPPGRRPGSPRRTCRCRRRTRPDRPRAWKQATPREAARRALGTGPTAASFPQMRKTSMGGRDRRGASRATGGGRLDARARRAARQAPRDRAPPPAPRPKAEQSRASLWRPKHHC